MWLLFVTSVIATFGGAHGLFGKPAPKNPEANMNISQMITYWGYPSEEYEVITEDGYVLGVYRIPYGRKISENIDAGYDVWLGNSRGNAWSKKNLYFSPGSAEFWHFGFDEMAKYDLPATIDFIVQKTRQKKIHYVGHSQGTTIGFIAFSTNPTLAEKIKMFYALAPVATVIYLPIPLKALTVIPEPIVKIILGNKMFPPHNFLHQFLDHEVWSRELIDHLWSNALSLIGGFDIKNLNVSRFDVYLAHNPSGTSVQNMLHWIQVARSAKFQAYNWGSPAMNMLHHNQRTPPEYDVSAMTVPIAVWNGGKDNLADPKDVDMLLPKLSNLVYHKEIPYYNHFDFIWGMDAPQEIYDEMLSMLAKD
ncbi:gastric triacylglycerol lipase isoform X2 [Psammomys obesus]|uniref:gastric triacylglycerol lipase isoform X2 n=1 Tax=Psammomys obesus TaxID=48139 RepID=UPI002452EBFF|nr:gastric triacylglycerol lipase isoform X2 [Psammomys obesus]